MMATAVHFVWCTAQVGGGGEVNRFVNCLKCEHEGGTFHRLGKFYRFWCACRKVQSTRGQKTTQLESLSMQLN